ncbi:MAG: SulP family inorganic anion transporter, partial [Microbacteriaceae bacterium]
VLFLPRISTAVPAPLIAIIVVTMIVVFFQLQTPSVGDLGEVGGGLPGLTPWLVPFNLETLSIIWPTALSVAFVGLMETLLTAKLVDDITDTKSHKSRESWALGVANILAGFYGGIAGCAMIGQTVVNVTLGRARTRISTFVAGAFLLLLVTALSGLMELIPMVALAAVMMVVAVKTMNWHSVLPKTLFRMPKSETFVMVTTVVIVVITQNLAIGVGAGVVLAIVLFARRIAHVVTVERQLSHDSYRVDYRVLGPLFFGSSNDLVEQFSYALDPETVTIDFSQAQIWDASTVAVLDSIEAKYTQHNIVVTFTGLDPRSTEFHTRLSGHL